MRRAQEFVYPLNGRKIREVDSAYVDTYLDMIGRSSSLEDGQVRPCVSALRILLVDVVHLDWANAYDWETRLTACQDLAEDHPTLAREHDDAPFESKETATLGPEANEVLARVKEVTHVRGYSIRTEQTYGDWAKRFASFCGGHFPTETSKVREYLDYLASARKVAPATQAQALNALVFLYG